MRKRLKARRKLRLKPCPFCGGPQARVVIFGNRWAVFCPDCKCTAHGGCIKEYAAAAWNNRYERSDA